MKTPEDQIEALKDELENAYDEITDLKDRLQCAYDALEEIGEMAYRAI